MVATAIPSESHVSNTMRATEFSSTPRSVDSDPSSSTSTSVFSYPLINSQPPVRAIVGEQLFQLHQKFITAPLPSKAMFPWLHGVDGTSSPQNYFFGLEPYPFAAAIATATDPNIDRTTPSNPRLPLPEHRGLMFVHANDLDTGRLVGSVSPSEILQRTTLDSQGSVLNSINNTSNNGNDGQSQTGTNYDINNHPQMLHQHSTATATGGGTAAIDVSASASVVHEQHLDHVQVQDQEDAGAGACSSSEWADISDDSVGSSSLSSSSLSSTMSSSFNTSTHPNNILESNISIPYSGSHTRTLRSSFIHSLSEGINIRNFKIQVPRYALLSDIVLYAKEGEQDPNLLQIAKMISVAQEEVWQTMRELHPEQATNESRRQTLVLTDTLASFETRYPEMVSITNTGSVGRNKVDFWEQEREQMSLLTRASEIAPGVWLGNNSDVPLVNTGASSLATPISPGSSFSSYFFSPPSSIPNTLSQNGHHEKSSAIPNTPPPDETEYPPLTPPSFKDHVNFQPSVCIECRSGSNCPTVMTLDRIRNNIEGSSAPLTAKEIFHLECLGSLAAGLSPEAFPPSTSSLSSFARPAFVDVQSTHAMRRATAAGLVHGHHQLPNSMLQNQITHLINMAFFIHSIVAPDKLALSARQRQQLEQGLHNHQRHQVLIHCVDGYTETALLALCVVMIHYELSLAEAYVKLQTELGRSFFVYPNDAIVMLEVESQVWYRILLDRTEREASAKLRASIVTTSTATIGTSTATISAVPSMEDAMNGTSTSTPTSGMSSMSSSMSSYSSTFFASLLNMTGENQQEQRLQREKEKQQHEVDENGNLVPSCISVVSTIDSESTLVSNTIMMMEGIEAMPDRDQDLSSQRPFVQPGHEERFEWFYHPEFEGSFPSRILPFLYLGNLAHASNPGLLKSLGIQYVLSVGEEAHGLTEAEFSREMEGNGTGKAKNNGSTRFMVKLVDDMFDNGVDSLWRHIETCVAFVDEARRANARVLIHCRVGVSRSATIVIAYLMAHYNLSLVDAYLMVRARRLSVIIQPNLLFMYELLQWEQRLRGRFDPMGWPGIAKEVHNLNMFYIGN
ncbi:tyrosine/serine/threonine protein phosphatase pps1 [Mortierella sp. GBA30]|nr:tyrosine/serine/threonine protein phosphatase pps1 [Mortierella sp. GBA30]